MTHLPAILRRTREAGHLIFTSGLYNLNLVGVRTASRSGNAFDDHLFAAYQEPVQQGDRIIPEWRVWHWSVTTDPGTYHLANPGRVAGTAVLKAGQYRGTWKLGLHRGRYEALVQSKPVTVYRDPDRDAVIEMEPGNEHTGIFGINIHRANSARESTQVDKWSAGCQVFSHPQDFAQFIAICKKQIEHHPTWTNFTYTLLED